MLFVAHHGVVGQRPFIVRFSPPRDRIPGTPTKSAAIGGSVELSGYTATVSATSFKQTLSMIEEDGYIVADVTVFPGVFVSLFGCYKVGPRATGGGAS